jgi:dihydrofolate synthase/folylpolyglutamate synthase
MNRSGNLLCREMLRRLHYSKHCPVITVAGTNGKGTSCHLLADYFQRRGKKVGLFTSPHLISFNERIVVDQLKATDAMIADAMMQVNAVQGDLELGYFHQAFLAAMLICKEADVDLLILEVGIGGRLDAVNSIDADAVLLTSIALDHTEILGETREQIGFEKAGILRTGQIAVCGDVAPPQSILAEADRWGVSLALRDRDFNFQDIANYPIAYIPRQNALAVWALLQRIDADFDAFIFGVSLANLRVPGRMECIAVQPEILIDVAHNPEAAGYLSDYLRSSPVSGKTYAVFSALKEKDILHLCQPLWKIVNSWFLIELVHERAADFEGLHRALPDSNYIDFQSMPGLYQSVLKKAGPEDRIVVFGSFMLVSLFIECHNQERLLLGGVRGSII